jgi:hypothetical protein
MEFDIRMPGTDPSERRRLQIRLAQRKFRRECNPTPFLSMLSSPVKHE